MVPGGSCGVVCLDSLGVGRRLEAAGVAAPAPHFARSWIHPWLSAVYRHEILLLLQQRDSDLGSISAKRAGR